VVEIHELKSKVYELLTEMGYSFLRLKITSFSKDTGFYTVKGEFDDMQRSLGALGNTISFRARYNENAKSFESFEEISARPRII
jgi:hypothetical protein